MTYALDTNIVSDYLKGGPKVMARLRAALESDAVAITPVSWFEVLRGRMASVLTAADEGQLRTAFDRFEADRERLVEFPELDYTPEVGAHFDRLRANKKLKKIGREDLLIACLALAPQATLVTRNLKDFRLVPGLVVENWAD
jgi:tRNA(fMet)-specific endonuclease VapC